MSNLQTLCCSATWKIAYCTHSERRDRGDAAVVFVRKAWHCSNCKFVEYAAIHYFAHYRSWRYFGEEGEESITVEVSQRKHDNSTDIAICDTMRINDDGSLNIPNVNPRKHQGTWHCLDSQGNGATLDIRLQITKGKKDFKMSPFHY